MFNTLTEYDTRCGFKAIVLHKCDSQMHQMIGYIILDDGEEVPAVWTSEGEFFSRACGYVTKADEFNLISRYEAEP